jgi:uncharacterized membrane protein YkoI
LHEAVDISRRLKVKKLLSLTIIVIAGFLAASLMSPVSIKSQTKPAAQKPEKSKSQKPKKETQSQLAKEAKITMAEARTIALKQATGAVESAELEREHGVLIYSFDIRTGKDITEVQVNAIDGKIVAIEHEDAKKEAKEKAKETKAKSSTGTKK